MPRPRVLLIVTHLDPGGAQETVVLLAEGLAERGFDVTVAARPGGEEEPRIVAAGAALEPLDHLYRAVSPRRDVAAYREIARLLARGRFDVVHTHSSKAGVLGRIAARRGHVPAVVHTSHGLPVNPDMSAPARALLIAAERAAARACDAVVAVSHATAAELRELRLARPEQISVVPSGVDLRRFRRVSRADARRRLDLGREDPVVGWVGRYFDQKRPDHVVEAARRLLEEVPRATILLVGDGPLMERTRAQAAGEPRIRFLGHRADVESIYPALDVMILASAWEGLPRTVIEAQAAGVPVVSTNVSGIPEVVIHGETGCLVEPGRPEELGAAAATLLGDEAARRRMGAAAGTRISDVYSSDHTADATAALYREILSRKRSRSRR
ncbi:MAG: glycosyltransferase family 4 protein [Actinomycetota bacterium]|nr:glycosyltransferase family 4 protein [Actinomycetota bacterium]